MALASGRLRHRVTIERAVPYVDDEGNTYSDWELVLANVPAAIEPISVREFISANAMQSHITHRIVIRARTGLEAGMRILHGTRVYDPQGWLPDPDSGREYLTAPCVDRGEQPVTFDWLLAESGDTLIAEQGDSLAVTEGDDETPDPTALTLDREDITLDRADITLDTTEA